MFFWWDSYHRRAEARGVPWAKIEEYRRLPLACVGGPLYVVSLFWIGWTSRPNIHWAVPMMSGVLFGTGYMLLFIAILNYLTDAYETFSASAHSASSCTRSVFGAAVPIAASPMFSTLGVNWACSLLAFVSLAMSVIPFVFIKCGQRIREGSKFCQHLRQLREERRREEEAVGFATQISPISRPDEEKGQVSCDMRRTQSHASALP